MKASMTIALVAGAVALAAPIIAHRIYRHENAFTLKPASTMRVLDDAPKYLFCHEDTGNFAVKPDHVFLVIKDVQRSEEIEHGVVGIPVAVLMLDLNGKAHLFSNKMPKCAKSDGAQS